MRIGGLWVQFDGVTEVRHSFIQPPHGNIRCPSRNVRVSKLGLHFQRMSVALYTSQMQFKFRTETRSPR